MTPREGNLGSTPPPARLGPYEILGPLGTGGMGRVYRARDTRLQRTVAIKVLLPEFAQDPHFRARFEQEAKAAGSLNHPNIVSIYDVGSDSGATYIVSELVEGTSLRELIDQGPVPVRRSLAIGMELAEAIAAAHATGVVHRDLKPENIMLTKQGHVKVLDFGLAKSVLVSGVVASGETQLLTQPGVLLGTPSYMSPEQVKMQPVDQRSDIFSFGSVLYELVSGKRAFTSDNAIGIMHAITSSEPEPLPAGVPRGLVQLLQRCLAKEPANRFQSAADLGYALKMIDSGLVESPLSIESKQPNQRGARMWAAAAVLAIVVVGAVGYWTMRQKDHPDSVSGSPKGKATVAAGSEAGNVGGENTASKTGISVTTGPQSDSVSQHSDKRSGRKTEAVSKETVSRADGGGAGADHAGPNQQAITGAAVITTVAGREWKFAADGLPALQVALGSSFGVAVDNDGNIYAADHRTHAIVKIDQRGILHVLAGPVSVPRNRPSNPYSLAIDSSGVIYFGENGQRLRKLLPSGEVTTIAGSDRRGFSPDGSVAAGSAVASVTGIAVAADGSVLFSEWENNRVRRVDAQGRLRTVAGDGQGRFAGDGGPAVQASLFHPEQLALDHAGNLYVADRDNRRVRKIALDGRISTVAGPLVCPTGVTVNKKDEVYLADPCRRQVFVVRNGSASPVGGTGPSNWEPSGMGGPATAASFDEMSLASDDNGLLVSSPDQGHIYRIASDGRFSIAAGTGNWRATADGTPARQASFQVPSHLAFDGAGEIFLSDANGNRIYRIDRNGTVTRIAGNGHGVYRGEGVLAKQTMVAEPRGIRVRPDGTLIFVERGSNRIRQITPDGILRTLAGNGRAEYSGDGGPAVQAALNQPIEVCLDASGNVYVADTSNQRVRKIAPDGTIQLLAGNGVRGFSGDGGPAERASLNDPIGLELGPDGSLYIADTGNRRVRRVYRGVISTVVSDGLLSISQLTMGPDGALYITDPTAARVRRLDLKTGVLTVAAGNGDQSASGDGGAAIEAGLGDPRGLAFDPGGNLYVTDIKTGLLRVIRPGQSPSRQRQAK